MAGHQEGDDDEGSDTQGNRQARARVSTTRGSDASREAFLRIPDCRGSGASREAFLQINQPSPIPPAGASPNHGVMPLVRPGSAALRRFRLSRDGQIYLVTFVTRERRALFAEPDVASACVAAIVDERTWQRSRLLAWVLMPDHWHGLIELGGREGLSRLVRGLKCCSSRRVRADFPGIGAVWDRGFHDRAVRRDDDVRDMARYIVLNPVRARLVRRVRDYPYWGAVWCDA